MNFRNLFSSTKISTKEDNPGIWKALEKTETLDRIREDSHQRPQVLFKHSTRCGISRMVWSKSRMALENLADKADLYFLDLISYRQVSDAIAEEFEVVHESPQLLVIRDGKAVAHYSHGDITQVDLDTLLAL